MSASIISHLKLELLKQFPVSNDDKIQVYENKHVSNKIIWLNEHWPQIAGLFYLVWNFLKNLCIKPT